MVDEYLVILPQCNRFGHALLLDIEANWYHVGAKVIEGSAADEILITIGPHQISHDIAMGEITAFTGKELNAANELIFPVSNGILSLFKVNGEYYVSKIRITRREDGNYSSIKPIGPMGFDKVYNAFLAPHYRVVRFRRV